MIDATTTAIATTITIITNITNTITTTTNSTANTHNTNAAAAAAATTTTKIFDADQHHQLNYSFPNDYIRLRRAASVGAGAFLVHGLSIAA